MESKKRDVWSDREIREMLSIINETHIMQLIDGKTKRNKNIFVDIATEMKKNIAKSDVQIRNKFKSLKSDFYKAKRSNNKSGAKRQTSEHFDLLDDIFGHRPALEAVGVDTIEMDLVEEPKSNPFNDEFICLPEEDISFISSQDEEPTTSKSQGFKTTKKNSYQKVVDTFTKEWADSQEVMLEQIREQDKKLVDYQAEKQEDIMERNRKAMKEMLEEDRQETSKMIQNFLNALQPAQPYMFQSPQFVLPKLSPP